MSKRHFDLNRPVHLARRDAFFERAAELLYTPVTDMDAAGRLAHVTHVLELLGTAEQHAAFASRSSQVTDAEKDFLHFLRLIEGNLKSVHSMTQHESHLEGEKGFLCRFLNATVEECALPALHYRRRADDILQGIWHLLRLAHTPYQALRHANLATLAGEDLQRYRRAYDSFRQEVMPEPAAAAPVG